MQKYLYYWLLLTGAGHFILGLLFMLVANTSLITPYLDELYLLFHVNFDSANDQLLRTILQLFGPTVSSWGILFCLAIHLYMKFGSLYIKQTIITALLVWFFADTGLSIYNGIFSHVIINCFAILAILPALLLLRPKSLCSTEE